MSDVKLFDRNDDPKCQSLDFFSFVDERFVFLFGMDEVDVNFHKEESRREEKRCEEEFLHLNECSCIESLSDAAENEESSLEIDAISICSLFKERSRSSSMVSILDLLRIFDSITVDIRLAFSEDEKDSLIGIVVNKLLKESFKLEKL